MNTKDMILIVDDDEDMRETIRALLELDGFNVIEAGDAQGMYKMLESHKVSLILLDLVLPDSDGLTIMRQFRPKSNIPVVMLTGKGDVIDKIVGLEIGADDYITKPFHNRELTARIKSVLRRHAPAIAPVAEEETKARIAVFEGWNLDFYAHTLSGPDGHEVKITSHEFALLKALVESAGRVLTRDQLLDLIGSGGREWSPYDRSLDVLVAKVRKILGDSPKSPKFIRTIRQSGYMFIADVG